MVFFFVKKTYGLLIHIGFSKKNIFSVSEKPYGLVILMSFFFKYLIFIRKKIGKTKNIYIDFSLFIIDFINDLFII